jgi:peptidoglycan hydrolase-like protein with peptidoglycan-binding domain
VGSAVVKLGGSNNSDYPLYTETVHQANARAAGLLVHHYWANGQVGTPEQIAEAIVRTGQVLPGEKIALDIESWPNEAREWNPTEAATVADALHDRGIPYSDIPVYLSQALLRKYDWAPVVERGMPLWLAAWDEGPALVEDFDDVWLRQYTSSSNAELRKLYPGDLDLNRAPDDVWTVKQLQTALGVEADGDYGPITTAAVRNHQAANGLYVDGIAGPLTLATLRKGGA